MTKQLALRSAAARDAEDATRHYAGDSGSPLAVEFVEALHEAYSWVVEHPQTGSPRYSEMLRMGGLRGWRVKRFPYLLLYVEHATNVEVVRILHIRRDISAAFVED